MVISKPTLLLMAVGIGIISAGLVGCGQAKEVDPTQENKPAPTAGQVAAENSLPFYELKMTPKDLARLEQTAFSNDTYPATFIANGVAYDGVRVRHRGQWARSWRKKPLNIFFNPDHLLQCKHCLTLNSAWRDPAFVR